MNPTQPPLGAKPSATTEPSAADRELATYLSAEIWQRVTGKEQAAQLIAAHVAEATATARAALAQCEGRLAALTAEHAKLRQQFGDELRADQAAQLKEDIAAREGQRMSDVIHHKDFPVELEPRFP